ncbi:MAG: DUF768 domain-containing protein, partial [Mesorhizobium sp.]
MSAMSTRGTDFLYKWI